MTSQAEAARAQIAERRKKIDAATADALHRTESLTPTPTQEENDLMGLGVQTDEKADHGAEAEDVAQARLMLAHLDPEAAQLYHTRTMEKRGASAPKRAPNATPAKT